MKRPVSALLAVMRSVEYRMVRISWPWALSKPVRSTTARHPPSGVFMCAPPRRAAVCCRILVPPNRTCCLLALMLNRRCGSRCAGPPRSGSPSPASAPAPPALMPTFHCGVDSPVSTASSQMQVPASSRQSVGTTHSPSSATAGRPMEMTSPGSSASPGSRSHLPPRWTWMCCLGVCSACSSARLRCLWNTTVASNTTSMTSVKME
mmetsp:Transcript_20169/g.50755  ORF Transcript_20169/g.50755 Transcript_20169/m.50755 type:complete len:206 (+) Transcript_20169:2682-3299(+)